MWCVAELDEESIARMEDVRSVYEKTVSTREPVVCIAERPVVLHQEVRPPVVMRPGRVARRDSEYKRGGTAHVFCGVEPKAGRHFPKVTASRSAPEFADYLLDIAVGYPEYHPSGDGHSEFAHAQSGRRTLRCRGRRLAVEPVYGALHPQARQLVKPSGDRDQPVFPAMLGPTPDWGSSFSAEADSGMEPPRESRPRHDPVELYSQAGSPEVWLQNHTVTVLEAARTLKDRMPSVAIILFTLHAYPSIEAEARSAGVDAVVSKSDVSVLKQQARSILYGNAA